jgi:cytochrome c
MRTAVCLGVGLVILTAMLVTYGRLAIADEVKPTVELGKDLFGDPSLGTNGKTCATCHPSEKKVGALAAKGTWFGGSAKTLEQAINICIKGPLEGKPLPEDSVEAKSISMYMKSLVSK